MSGKAVGEIGGTPGYFRVVYQLLGLNQIG
jgi:hypothetical protein